MIKINLMILFCVAFAFAAPVSKEPSKHRVEIVESGQEKLEDGSYSFHFRGEDGSFREEIGILKNPGRDDEYIEVVGSYSYFDSDGKEIVVSYKADDRGFVPEGGNISQQISMAAKQASEQVEQLHSEAIEQKEKEKSTPKHNGNFDVNFTTFKEIRSEKDMFFTVNQ